MSSGLAQYLLAIARYDSSKLKWSWEQIMRGKKKDQAGTPLHTAGGETMREDACGGADAVFFPLRAELRSRSAEVHPCKQTIWGFFVPPQQQIHRLTCETLTTNLLTQVIGSSHTTFSPSKSSPRSVKSRPLLSPFSFLMTPSHPHHHRPNPPPYSAHTPVLSLNFICSAPPNQQLGRRND